MSNDREDKDHSMDAPTTSQQYVAAELGRALTEQNIGWSECAPVGDRVSLSFTGLADAQALMVLLFKGPAGPGSLYDRAGGSCVALSDFAEREVASGEPVSDEELDKAFNAGWLWEVHPAMNGRAVVWHTSVTIPRIDAVCAASILSPAIQNGWDL